MSESETERLRRRLEELGVFCLPYPEDDQHTPRLCWKGDEDDDGYCYFFEDDFHVTELLMTALSAEQAIEATIGRGKCHAVSMDCFGNPPYNKSGLNGNSTACGCSECGAPWSTCGMFRGNKLNHNFKACPICGREVER